MARFDSDWSGFVSGGSIKQRNSGSNTKKKHRESPVACVAVDAPALVADMGPLLISPHHQRGSHTLVWLGFAEHTPGPDASDTPPVSVASVGTWTACSPFHHRQYGVPMGKWEETARRIQRRAPHLKYRPSAIHSIDCYHTQFFLSLVLLERASKQC